MPSIHPEDMTEPQAMAILDALIAQIPDIPVPLDELAESLRAAEERDIANGWRPGTPPPMPYAIAGARPIGGPGLATMTAHGTGGTQAAQSLADTISALAKPEQG